MKTKVNIIHEDSADNKFLECALDGDADHVVSGDEHLLRIEHYQGIRILSVRQFLKLMAVANDLPKVDGAAADDEAIDSARLS